MASSMLPVKVRNLLGIKEGDHLAVYVNDEELILRKFLVVKIIGGAGYCFLGYFQPSFRLRQGNFPLLF
ncbi:MAG: hypothetical protein C4589_05035 [Peptococcaceae bacterium]|nr:MAG: hypothetical protein C4589_05035 [Peptococcaceae bacterium]